MKLTYFVAITILCTAFYFNTFSQTFSKSAIVIEGGDFSDPANHVRFGSYSTLTNNYRIFDSIPGNYTNDAIVDTGFAYLHVGASLPENEYVYKYELGCFEKIDSLNLPGLLRMAISGNKLLVTRGFGADSNFVQIYDKQNLSLLANIDEIGDFTQGIEIGNGKAFVAVTGAWPTYTDTGTIAVIDLTTNSFERFLKLDTFANHVNEIFSYAGFLYILTNNEILSIYDLQNDTFANFNVGFIGSPLGILNGKLWASFDFQLKAFDILSRTLEAGSLFENDFIAGEPDTLNDEFFLINSDFFSYGNFQRIDATGTMLDSFGIGISATAIAMNYAENEPIENLSNTLEFAIKYDDDTSFQLSNYFVDPDCDDLSVTAISGPNIIGATLEFNDDFSLTYNPAIGIVARDTVKIEACDFSECDTLTLIIHVTSLSSAPSSKEGFSVKIFPNPTSTFLDVKIKYPQQFKGLQIHKINGEQIEFGEIAKDERGSFSINTSNFENGVYFLKLKFENEWVIRRFLKM